MTAGASDPLDQGTVKAGEADAAIVPPTRIPLTATFVPCGTTEYYRAKSTQAQNQVSHSGMEDSGKAAKFFTCTPKATQASY